MGTDELMNCLIDRYERKAEELSKSLDQTEQYHGTTGVLLVHVVKNLFSKQDISTQVTEITDRVIAAHVASCEAIRRTQSELTIRGVVLRNFRLIVVCVTVILGSGMIFGKLPDLRDFIRGLRTDTRMSQLQ